MAQSSEKWQNFKKIGIADIVLKTRFSFKFLEKKYFYGKMTLN
jgi:hypothetical protein